MRAGYLARLAESVANNQKAETARGNFIGINGIAMGLGVKIGELHLDYALSPFGELGNTQTVSLTTSFGGTNETKKLPLPNVEEKQPAKDKPAAPVIETPTDTNVQFNIPNQNEPWWTSDR